MARAPARRVRRAHPALGSLDLVAADAQRRARRLQAEPAGPRAAPARPVAFDMAAGFVLTTAAAAMLCDVVMWFLTPGYDPVAQTISELGAGPRAWLQDGGITLLAVGVLVLGLCALMLKRGWRSASLGGVLAVMAGALAVIALHDEYGDGDAGGLTLHAEAVAVLGVCVALAGGLCGALTRRPGTRAGFFAATGAWVLAAPWFFVVKTGWDGAYERGLALLMLGIVTAAALLMRRAAA